MPVFRKPAGPARRLAAAALLLPLIAAGCAAADPALPELQATARPAPAAAESAFAGYQTFAPDARDTWQQAQAAGDGMGMPMDHGMMDHSKMDHGTMQPGMIMPMPMQMPMTMPMAPATPPQPSADDQPAHPPAHRH